MKLVGSKLCVLIEDFFSPGITAGFSKPSLKTGSAEDIRQVLSGLGKKATPVYMYQPHSAKVKIIKTPGVYDCDAVFTESKSNALVVRTADCLPLIFSDDSSSIIGILHLGWCPAQKGILDNIPYDLSSFKVFAGVGLRSCCYEVGQEFMDSNLAEYISGRDKKLYFDPINFARDKLASRGLSKDNFFDLKLCSFCSKGEYFSYRKTKTKNRTFSFILNF